MFFFRCIPLKNIGLTNVLQTYIYNPSAETSRYPENESSSGQTYYNSSFCDEKVKYDQKKDQINMINEEFSSRNSIVFMLLNKKYQPSINFRNEKHNYKN